MPASHLRRSVLAPPRPDTGAPLRAGRPPWGHHERQPVREPGLAHVRFAFSSERWMVCGSSSSFDLPC